MDQKIRHCNHRWWTELTKRCKHSVLFLDDRAAETFHWNVSISTLFDSNVVGIRELKPNQPVPSDCKKAIFIVSDLLFPGSDSFKSIRSIVQENEFHYCIIVTTASHYCYSVARNHWEESVSYSQSPGNPYFEKLENWLVEWMRNANYTAEVLHIPLFLGFPSEDLLLTIPFGDMNPLLGEKDFHTDFMKLSESLKERIQIFVSCWNSLLAALDAKEDCYCIGPFSSIIASRLAHFGPAKSRRKTATNKVSLIFVDRTVDLLEVLRSPVTPAMDRILFSLPRFPGHFNERIVPMGEEELPGTLFHFSEEPEELYRFCLENSYQDCVQKAAKCLNSALFQEEKGLEEKSGNKKLEEAVFLGKSEPSIQLNHCELLELCQGISATYTAAECKQKHQLWGRLAKRSKQTQFSLDKLLRLVFSDKLSVEEELLCLAVLYSTKADQSASWTIDEYLGNLIERILNSDRDGTLPFWLKGLEINFDVQSSRKSAEGIFDKLGTIARLKRILELGKNGSYLCDLVTRLLNPELAELSDVVCKTTGLTDVLRSSLGFGVLGNVMGRSSHPSDADTVILFMLGGITPGELLTVRKVLSEGGFQKKVLIGGTQLVCAKDVLENLFMI